MPGVRNKPKVWITLICLQPLMRLIAVGGSGGLGANPIEFITHIAVTSTHTMMRRLGRR